MCTSSSVRAVVVLVVAVIVSLVAPVGRVARGAQLPNPAITNAADPFNSTYGAQNVFDDRGREFATSSNGAGTPFSEDPNDGTWIDFDFGEPVTVDTFINRTRTSPPGFDVIEESRLIFSDDETFSAADRIVSFNPSGFAGAGLVQRFAPQTGRYVRWEVVTASGQFGNTGSRQMFFMRTPAGLVPLANPTVTGGSPAFNGNYALQNAANGNAGRDGSGNEYASAGQGANTFVNFDFGSAKQIAGFDFLNREEDIITAYDMVFSNVPDFSTEVARMSFTGDPNGNVVNSELFDPVTARYVRLQATSFAQSPNTGISEIIFYTPVPEPGAAGLACMGGIVALLRRRR